jgi:hypothetical protein
MSTYIPPPGGYPQGPEACLTPCTCPDGDVGCSDMGPEYCEVMTTRRPAPCALSSSLPPASHLTHHPSSLRVSQEEYEDTGDCPPVCTELTRRQSCQPLVESFSQPLWALLPIYVLGALVLLVVVSVVAKNVLARRNRGISSAAAASRSRREQRPRDKLSESLLVSDGDEDREMPCALSLEDGTQLVGYVDSALGDCCIAALVLFTVVLFLLYWVIIADFYWQCEFSGLDNCCLLGAHPIFGDYDVNSKVFFSGLLASRVQSFRVTTSLLASRVTLSRACRCDVAGVLRLVGRDAGLGRLLRPPPGAAPQLVPHSLVDRLVCVRGDLEAGAASVASV